MLWLSRYTHSFVASFPTIRQKLSKGYSALSISTLCRYYGRSCFSIKQHQARFHLKSFLQTGPSSRADPQSTAPATTKLTPAPLYQQKKSSSVKRAQRRLALAHCSSLKTHRCHPCTGSSSSPTTGPPTTVGRSSPISP